MSCYEANSTLVAGDDIGLASSSEDGTCERVKVHPMACPMTSNGHQRRTTSSVGNSRCTCCQTHRWIPCKVTMRCTSMSHPDFQDAARNRSGRL